MTQLDRIEEKLDKVHDAIYGNGKDGLMTRMAVVEKDQKSDTWRWRAIFGMMAVVIGKVVYQVITHLMTI